MNYGNKAMLVGAMIVGGWDAREGGQVYGCPIGGTLVREKWTTDGSGSTYIWGYLDSAYRCMTKSSIGDLYLLSKAHELSDISNGNRHNTPG